MSDGKGVMLVTGAGGFVGRHMIELLLAHGQRVRATDLPAAASRPFPAGVEFVPADITRPETLAPVMAGVERVFHIAALFDYSASEERLRRVNVDGTRYLLDAAQAAGVRRVVYWSSGSVYGKNPGVSPTPETYSPEPYVAYERTKYEGEQACRDAQRRGLAVTILRPASIYGPGSVYATGTLVQAMRRGLVRVFPGSRRVRGAYVHVEDVCRAAYYLSGHPAGADVFNVTDDSTYTISDLLHFLAGLLKVPPPRMSLPGTILHVAGFALALASRLTGKRPILERDTIHYFLYDHLMDNSKIKSLGFAFRWPDTKAGMEATMRWYLSQESAKAS